MNQSYITVGINTSCRPTTILRYHDETKAILFSNWVVNEWNNLSSNEVESIIIIGYVLVLMYVTIIYTMRPSCQ